MKRGWNRNPHHRSSNPQTPLSKTERLGIMDGPMTATTLSLHGLDPDDAVEIVQRKINRALRANASTIKVLFAPGSRKLKRKLEEYLAGMDRVREVISDENQPGSLWIRF